ncbi:MAG: dinitrogenase iron-molybdenum cofactor biosynthesis protein [Chromatiaceae bacterium]|jgi:nitrogen fixation protein NifX|nr:dinitrogenase iron-molybdenum cofactor biosynthesis protein [Chromatiaceae bacterium]
MTQAPISDDIALRIALAARTLPDTSAARLIGVIEAAIGLPPTAKKLEGLQVKDLRRAFGSKLADIDDDALKAAVTILKGEANAVAEPPPVEPYEDGDMPSSIRVACASNGGDLLDGHFGSARRFLVYQVSSSENRLIDVRLADESRDGDKNADRARLIADCQVLYVASIGGPAAAKVVKTGIHPIKDPKGGSSRERILALQEVLGDKAPPWLAKVMGWSPEERVRFEREESDA